MRRMWLATALLILSACDGRASPLAAYRHAGDALASVLPLGMLGIYPCASRQEESGIDVIVGVPVDQCFKMLPAERFRGIWLDQFEGSTFFEGASDAKTVKAELRRRMTTSTADGEWLSWDDANRAISLPPSSNARLIAIDFIGRRTAYRGRYGHMGMSNSEVVVDRMISARPIYEASTSYLEDELTRK